MKKTNFFVVSGEYTRQKVERLALADGKLPQHLNGFGSWHEQRQSLM